MMDALASPSALSSNASMSEHMQYQIHQQHQVASLNESYCGGCKQTIESESGGVVVSFGQIQELVFAKTSNGIYCMACHNERVARSRRHAERKRDKSKSSRKDKDKERERRPKDVPPTPGRPGLPPNASVPSSSMSLNSPSALDTPTSSSGRSPISSSATPTPATVYSAQTSFPFNTNKRASTQSIQRVLNEAVGGIPSSPPHAVHASSSVPPANRQRQATPPSRPSTSMDHNPQAEPQMAHHAQTLPLPAADGDSYDDSRRHKSYDDGVRPLSHFLGQTAKPGMHGLGTSGGSGTELGVPGMTRAEKRRSINPGLYLDGATIAKSIAEAGAGPSSSSPPAVVNGRLSPNPTGSPLRRSFGSDGPASPSLDIHSAYFSPQQSPAPESIRRGSGSRSPSPVPATLQSYPSNLNQGSYTPPSLNVTVPTPGHTPAKPSLGQLYEPLRTNSLPNPDHQRIGRSPSPALGGRNSPMLGNGVNGRRRSPSSARSDGFETDGDVVVVPREGRKSTDTQSDKPPPPPPKENGRSASGHAKSPVPAEIEASESEGDLLEYEMDNDRVEVTKPKEPLVIPALPPMRFSISDTDFSSLLKQVDPSIRITLDSDEEKEKKEKEKKKSGDSIEGTMASMESSTGSLAIRESPSPMDEVSGDESYMFEEGDVTIVLAPGLKEGMNPADGTSGSPVATTPTSVTTVRDKPLGVNIPSDAPEEDDTPPTPPPSSAKSSSPVGSAPFPTTHARATTTPMSLHQSAVLHATEQNQRQRVDSSASVPSLAVTPPAGSPPTSGSLPTINISSVLNNNNNRPAAVRTDSTSAELVGRRLREALKDSNERGLTNVKFDREFVEAIVRSLDSTKEKAIDLKGQIDTMKRTSQQYLAGFSVAQTEYHKEVAARRDAEAEITRLRVQLSGQAARLTAMSAEHRRQEMMEQMSKDLSSNLGNLEKDVSKLKVERDMALAEVEELNASPNSPALNDAPSTLTRSLTTRFDNLKSQYKKDLEPLKQQREALIREINELKEARDIFLEETTALNARNEELAELNSQIQRQIEATLNETNIAGDTGSISTTAATAVEHPASSSENGHTLKSSKGMPMTNIFNGAKAVKSSSTSIATAGTGGPPSNSPSYSSVNTAIGSVEDHEYGARVVTSTKGVYQHAREIVPEPTPAKGSKFKWFGGAMKEKKQKQKAHNFAAVNILRFARCEYCNDKMWGPQFRCQGCGITCHQRCQTMLQTACQQNATREDQVIVDIAPLPPSMFGRDLVEQVKADARGSDRAIPVIVEKCIEAVETLAMDYEGIYRKTGGTGQSKVITQLFEKGNYEAFDLRDTDSFNDICSVTS
ncbi:hypothetical protein FRC00_006022, partial [Tulasnella sp. 408]